MDSDSPIGFFITWTVYGTWLQGDFRGWRQHRGGDQLPQPRLSEWRRNRMKHPVLLLDEQQRHAVEAECERHCLHRGWHLWRVNARSNHVHVVVTSNEINGKTVRDQLKANATRGLRERWTQFRDRPVWSVGGDWKAINSEDDLETIVIYVGEAQDRMDRKK